METEDSNNIQYLNSFALISFDFDDAQNTVKYEYFVRDGEKNSTISAETNSIEYEVVERNIEEDQQPEEAFISYWIKNDNGELNILPLSSVVDDQDLMTMFAGPFASYYSAQNFIDKLDECTLNF